MRKFFDVVAQYGRTLRSIIPLIWKASPTFFLVLFSLTLLTGLLPAASVFINAALLGLLVDVTKHPNDFSDHIRQLLFLLGALGGVTLISQVLTLVRGNVQQLYQTRIANYVQLLIAEKATAIDLEAFENATFHNQMRNAIGDAASRPLIIVQSLTGLVAILTTFVTLAGIIVLWQWWILPIISLASLAQLWISTRFGKARVEMVAQRAATERRKRYMNTLLSSESDAKEIRLFGLRSFLLGKFRSLLEITYEQDKQLATRQLRSSVLIELLLAAVQPLVIGFTALQVIQQQIPISSFSLYTQSILQLTICTLGLVSALSGLYENNLFVHYLFSFLALQPEVEAPRPQSKKYKSQISSHPCIEFKNVSFRYPGTERWILHDMSCVFQPGESIALVGENGAGKTTLVKLITGLYEPTEGQVLFDNIDIKHLDRDDLRSYLSIIFQDYIIYQFSIAENIGVGQIQCIEDRARIEAAGKRSGLERLIGKLTDGYETRLGRSWAGGHEFSGGQKQLTALARALMRNAPILILDEPSAALDIYTEQQFFQRLLENQQDYLQTVIFISHRFTTVRRADRILVIEQGKLIEQGSHEDLMKHNGRYTEMFTMQADLYKSSPAVNVEAIPQEKKVFGKKRLLLFE